jgi:hypothetical protein
MRKKQPLELVKYIFYSMRSVLLRMIPQYIGLNVLLTGKYIFFFGIIALEVAFSSAMCAQVFAPTPCDCVKYGAVPRGRDEY